MTGRSSSNDRKPGCPSTACSRLANRFSSSGPAPSGTSIALIFTTAMTQARPGSAGAAHGADLRRARSRGRRVRRERHPDPAAARADGPGDHLVAGGAVARRTRPRARSGRPRPRPLRGAGSVDHRADDGRRRRAARRGARRRAGRVVGHSMGGLHGLVARRAPSGAGAGARRRGHGRGLPRSQRRGRPCLVRRAAAAVPVARGRAAGVRLAAARVRRLHGRVRRGARRRLPPAGRGRAHHRDRGGVGRARPLGRGGGGPVPDAARRGRGERRAGRADGARWRTGCTAATHVRIPGTGHLVHAGDPGAYRRPWSRS